MSKRQPPKGGPRKRKSARIAPLRLHLDSLTPSKYDVLRRALDAISLKRRNPALSLSEAAKQSGTTLKTVRRYAADTLEIRSGRLDVKPRDNLPRALRMLTGRGEVTIVTRSSSTASRIARYNNAIRKYLVSGDARDLSAFAGKSVRSLGQRYEFLTDLPAINRLARAGAVHFLDIYAPAMES